MPFERRRGGSVLCSFRMYPYIAERWDVLENILRVLNAFGEGRGGSVLTCAALEGCTAERRDVLENIFRL